MKYKEKIKDPNTIMIIITVILFIALSLTIIFYNVNLLNNKSSSGSKSSAVKVKKKANLEEIINKVKEEHSEIVYESKENTKYKSIVYKESSNLNIEDIKDITSNKEYFNSVIIDIETGEELTFYDMLKVDKLEDFASKEDELLSLKYPEFIVDGIKKSEGHKVYYVTDKEVIIYYYDYTYNYDIKEDITLKIDFNEIKYKLN